MSDNPYHGPNEAGNIRVRKSLPYAGFWRLLLLACAVLLVGAMLLPMNRRGVPEAARRTVCKNNMRQLSLGIHNYESENGTLPPVFTVDAAGNRLHSWRTLILPYIEEQALYESIDLSKPWDDPVNAQAYATMPDVFHCPSSKIPSLQTTYLAVVVPGGCFGSETPRTFAEFTDGTSQTLMLIEVGQDHAVHWMSPNDADEKIIASLGSQTKLAHPQAFHAMTVDGACHLVPGDILPATLNKLISVAGKDPVDGLKF